ncbi:MAG: AI-2E family transporter [Proteobacteria bacterium]|nr:AI-2E family transporter [Pseudomonadota bacterium]
MPAELFERYARIAAIAILAVSCLLVLKPFVAAIVLAAVMCSATWPLYLALRRLLGERAGLAALVMSLLMAMVPIVPVALLAASITANVAEIVEAVKRMLAGGLPQPPDWLRGLPVFGDMADAYWHSLIDSRQEFDALLQRLSGPAKAMLLATGAVLGEGILQMLLVGFVGFFFYRDGEALMVALRATMARMAGSMSESIISTIDNTITSVLYGIVGTALAQAGVALAGFLIAGVPNAFVLAAATFFLSMVPVGPPLIWGGAAAWLAQRGEVGWAVFMVLYGLLVISSIDNFVKPYLISRGSSLSFALVFLGVLGGVLAFGLIGLFLGPVLLAVAVILLDYWMHPPPPGEGAKGG